MKKTIVFLTVFFIGVLCYAQQAAVIIPPFDLVGGVSQQERDTITRMFLGDLATKGIFRVADRGNVEKRMAETQWQLGDYSNSEKTAELNKGINADYLIIGTISKLGTITVVDVVLEDLNSFQVIGNSRIRMNNPEEAFDLMDGFVSTLVKNVSGGTSVRSGAVTSSGTIPADFVRIEGGTFTMGSSSTEVNRLDNEVQHQVTVNSFSMGKYEVTQAEYEAVMGSNPSFFKGGRLPVEQVSWYDAIEYCNKRSENERLSPAYTINKVRVDPNNTNDNDNVKWQVTWNKNASGYRLPTEAEWEYSCRAGMTGPFNTGSNITTAQANYDGNYPYNNNAKGTYREKTTDVGSFAANRWGLHDMHGNVYEWCWDWYGTYPVSAQSNPDGAVSGVYRVIRGGSWGDYAQYLRSADRGYGAPSDRSRNLGFRLVRP
jgi:formylglycine-generating enzyme required for sulfatase activity